MEIVLFIIGGILLTGMILTSMILTLVGIHKDVYKKPPQYNTLLHRSEHIYNYPIWMQKLKFHYTIMGALGFFVLLLLPIILILDTYNTLTFIISCCLIFIEYILYKGYDTFAKELRIIKYKKKLDEIEFERDNMSDYEYNVAKERILKFKS